MNRTSIRWLAVALVSLLPPAVWGADSIDAGSGPVSNNAGQITASGTYTLNPDTMLTSIRMSAYPDAGGAGNEASMMVDETNKTWSGGITSGLQSGATYDVVIVLIAKDGKVATKRYSVKVK
jgi:hypothetical protein